MPIGHLGALSSRIDLRIEEDDAIRYLPPGLGERIGHRLTGYVRKVVVRAEGPLWEHIGQVHRVLKRERGHGPFWSWRPIGTASAGALQTAAAFRMHITTVFEPAAR